jgi:hypothetical protein
MHRLTRSAAPTDRNDGQPLRSAPAASYAPFEVQHLCLRAEPEPQQKVRRQQRDVIAGGAIDLDEIATPEMRCDEGSATL